MMKWNNVVIDVDGILRKDSRSSRSALRDDVFNLYNLVVKHRPKRILEIGVDYGASTRALMLGLLKVRGDKIESIDNRDCSTILDILMPTPKLTKLAKEYWKFHLGDSKDKELLDTIEDFDFLFLDTSHVAEQTVVELDMWLPKLKPGGVAVFHDVKTRFEGVQIPLNDYFKKHPEFNCLYTTMPNSRHGLGVLMIEPKEVINKEIKKRDMTYAEAVEEATKLDNDELMEDELEKVNAKEDVKVENDKEIKEE